METTNEICCQPKRTRKIVFGLLVIATGLLLLAFNFGLLPDEWRHIFFSWQMLLVAIGLVNIATPQSRVLGTILIIVGSFFLIPRMIDFDFDFHRLFWAVILIAIGILIITKRSYRHHHRWNHTKTEFKMESGWLELKNIFGGGKHQITHQEFKGGQIVNVFGGTEIDFTQAVLADGKNELEIVSVFGGISMIVPADWTIHIEASSILGGIVDKRRYITGASQTTKELYIKGVSVLGGGEIKN